MVVLMDIVKNIMNCTKLLPKVTATQTEKEETKYWKHHQKIFELISLNYFGNNYYKCFSEYFYHLLMNFCIAWK